MDDKLRSIWSGIGHNLQQFSVRCAAQKETRSIILIHDSYCMPEGMLDFTLGKAVLEGAPVELPHPSDPEVHAISRTSKLGIAIAPAPPIRARMRVT